MKRHIITCTVLTLSFFAFACSPAESPTEPQAPNTFGFETKTDDGLDPIWDLTPDAATTARLDLETAFEGTASAQMVRTAESEGEFSSIGFRMPIASPEGTITLRAAIKVDEISGMASLWARQDGLTGRVAYTNLRQDSIRASQDWAIHELQVEVDPKATSLSVGVFLAGTGRINIDNFELSQNGQPMATELVSADAPEATRSDFEFASGSGIDISALSEVQTHNLSVFVKVWGFLKYHHPAVAGGEVDWDVAFLRALPMVLAFESDTQRNVWLNEWIAQLGNVAACDPCAVHTTGAALDANNSWIENGNELGETLSAQLLNIQVNRFSGEHQHYVKPGISGQAEFINEASYSILENTDSGFRILAVARYWNMIEYWFPYRDLISTNRTELLERSLNQVVEADTERDYQLAMTHLIARVEDTHANLASHLSILPPEGMCDVPVHVRFIEDAPTVVAFQAQAASARTFMIGDVIERIDGRDITDLLGEMRPLYAASNAAAQNRDMAVNLLRGDCGPVAVDVERNGQTLKVTDVRVRGALKNAISLPRDLPGDTAQVLSGNIGYIKLSSVTNQEVPAYIEKVRNTDGLILDLRNYPNDNVFFTLGKWFTVVPTSFVTFTLPSYGAPGEYVWLQGPKIPSMDASERLELPIAILVDDVTQSSGEYTAMAFRALPNSIVIGSQTAGADGNISRIVLPGNLMTRVSGLGVFYPDGTPTQQIGIVPDIYVTPTREGIIEGRDEVLEKALETLMAAAGE